MENERLALTVGEAAEALGISTSFAYKLVARGVLPSVKLGVRKTVVPVRALCDYLDAACQPAEGASDTEE